MCHPTYNKCQKCAGMGLNGFIFEKTNKIKILKRRKNPGSRLGFLFLFNIFIYLFKYETVETHARTSLTLIILAIGTASNAYLHAAVFSPDFCLKDSRCKCIKIEKKKH